MENENMPKYKYGYQSGWDAIYIYEAIPLVGSTPRVFAKVQNPTDAKMIVKSLNTTVEKVTRKEIKWK